MIASIYARKSTDQTGVSDEARFCIQLSHTPSYHPTLPLVPIPPEQTPAP